MAVKNNKNKKVEKNSKIEDVKIFFNEEEDKKTNKLALILIPLIVFTLLILGFILINKSETPNEVFTKTLTNMFSKNIENPIQSGKINTNLKIKTQNNLATFNVSYNTLFEQKNNNYKLALLVPKTLISDELSIYLEANDKLVNLYVPSSTVDFLLNTNSDEYVWLTYNVKISDMYSYFNINNIDIDIDYNKYLDEKHYYLLDKNNNINIYELFIDLELLKEILPEVNEQLNENQRIKENDLNEFYNNFNKLYKNGLKVQLYINTDTYYIEKITMDLLEKALQNEGIDDILLEINFEDLNNTEISIPEDALKSLESLEEYTNKYAKVEEN